MPVMTNAEAFEYDFGIYATELWSMTEEQFLTWLNAECDRERPRDAVKVIRCRDCRWTVMEADGVGLYVNMLKVTGIVQEGKNETD